MSVSAWPERLDDGTVVVALHVEGDRSGVRELLEVLVAGWLADEMERRHAFAEDLARPPYVEPRIEGGADVIFESRAEKTQWQHCVMCFSHWMLREGSLRPVSLDDRVGGESRSVVTISA